MRPVVSHGLALFAGVVLTITTYEVTRFVQNARAAMAAAERFAAAEEGAPGTARASRLTADGADERLRAKAGTTAAKTRGGLRTLDGPTRERLADKLDDPEFIARLQQKVEDPAAFRAQRLDQRKARRAQRLAEGLPVRGKAPAGAPAAEGAQPGAAEAKDTAK